MGLVTTSSPLPKEDVRFWMKLFQLLENNFPSGDSLYAKLNFNIQLIMRYYWKSCMSSTMVSLENLWTKTGAMLESYSSMSIPSTSLPTVQDSLLSLILLEMPSNIEGYSDMLLTPTKSTSGTTAPMETQVAGVNSKLSFNNLKRKLELNDDNAGILEKSGYLSAFISYSENEELKKYGLEEYVKGLLINVSNKLLQFL